MKRLQCDICGGTLIIQSGGKTAVCDSCGVQYSVERMREKVQEIRGIVSVEGTVRTQDADFIIRGGVLERYNGNDVHVVIPDSVVKIGEKAFEGCVGIQSVIFPPNVIEIGSHAFSSCHSLNEVRLSDTLVEIGSGSFWGCRSLKQVVLPESVKVIGNWAFKDCTCLETTNIPDTVEGGYHKLYGTFENCPALREVTISEEQKEKLFIYRDRSGCGSPMYAQDIFEEKGDDDGSTVYLVQNCGAWYLNFKREFAARELKRTQVNFRAEGKCQYCGGPFTGLFTKKCARCGELKDY